VDNKLMENDAAASITEHAVEVIGLNVLLVIVVEEPLSAACDALELAGFSSI
jgi:molecular chaperone DnaK (HSP70)